MSKQKLDNGSTIAEIRTKNKRLGIGKSFGGCWLASASLLVGSHMRNNHFSKIFNCCFLFILNVNVIAVGFDHTLSHISLLMQNILD